MGGYKIALSILGMAFIVGAKKGLEKHQQQMKELDKKVAVPLKTDTMWN